MSDAYSDPTFEAVAQAEERGCKPCRYKGRAFGMDYCAHPGKSEAELRRLAGSDNMRGCVDFEQKPQRRP